MGEKKASLALLQPFCELKKRRIVLETRQITLLKQIERKQQANLIFMLLNNWSCLENISSHLQCL